MQISKIVYMINKESDIDKRIIGDKLTLSNLYDYILTEEFYAVSKTEYMTSMKGYIGLEEKLSKTKNTLLYNNIVTLVNKWTFPIDPRWMYEILDKGNFLVIEFTRRHHVRHSDNQY